MFTSDTYITYIYVSQIPKRISADGEAPHGQSEVKSRSRLRPRSTRCRCRRALDLEEDVLMMLIWGRHEVHESDNAPPPEEATRRGRRKTSKGRGRLTSQSGLCSKTSSRRRISRIFSISHLHFHYVGNPTSSQRWTGSAVYK
jgi:hypothetical protein